MALRPETSPNTCRLVNLKSARKVVRICYIRFAAKISTLGAQSLFVGGHEVSMPKNEMANPMDIRGLTVVNGFVIVKTIQGLCNPRNSILLCQTQHGINVGLLL